MIVWLCAFSLNDTNPTMFGTRLLSKLLQPFLRLNRDNLVPRTAFGVPKFGLSDDQTNYSKALLVQSRPPYRPLGLGRILLAAPLVLPVAAAGSDDSDEDDSDDEHQVEDDSQGKQLWCSGDSYGYTKGMTVCLTAQLFIASGLIHTALGTQLCKSFINFHLNLILGRTLREKNKNYRRVSNFRLYPVAFVPGGKTSSMHFEVRFHGTER